jgi:hypothetical protein
MNTLFKTMTATTALFAATAAMADDRPIAMIIAQGGLGDGVMERRGQYRVSVGA